MNHSRGFRPSVLGTRWCCQPLAYPIEGQIGCAEDQPNRSSCSGMDAQTSSEIMPCYRKRADGRLRAATTQRTSEADLLSRCELASQYTSAAQHR